MIDFYTANTFNGRRVGLMLEETGLEYTTHWLNLMQGEQKQPDFLKLNPSGRIPVIVDHDTDNAEPFILTQSVAILQYLAEKTGLFIPESGVERARVFEWMHFHAIDIGSVLFSAFYLQKLCTPAQEQAAAQLSESVHSLYQHFDQQLASHEYIAGPEYSIADITILPAVIGKEAQMTEYTNLIRWLQQLKQRPAVQRVEKNCAEVAPPFAVK